MSEPSTFDFRYEVGDNTEIEYAARFEDAIRIARTFPDGATIFDRCARRGAVQLWRMRGGVAEIAERKGGEP